MHSPSIPNSSMTVRFSGILKRLGLRGSSNGLGAPSQADHDSIFPDRVPSLLILGLAFSADNIPTRLLETSQACSIEEPGISGYDLPGYPEMAFFASALPASTVAAMRTWAVLRLRVRGSRVGVAAARRGSDLGRRSAPVPGLLPGPGGQDGGSDPRGESGVVYAHG